MSCKTKFKCLDGPLRGRAVWLQCDGKTFVFRMKAWVGRYVRHSEKEVRWESAA